MMELTDIRIKNVTATRRILFLLLDWKMVEPSTEQALTNANRPYPWARLASNYEPLPRLSTIEMGKDFSPRLHGRDLGKRWVSTAMPHARADQKRGSVSAR